MAREHLEDIEFTIFDTETTGLDPESGDRIVEIAAIRLKGPKKLATFQSLINPSRPISEAAFNINHISADMLKNAPAASKIIPDFLDFIQGSYLCSYNATFDLEFLNYELKLLGKSALEDVLVIDVLKMARRLLPGLERYALWFVAERLGIKNKQEHRALSDVEFTLKVFNIFKEMLYTKGIFDTLNFTHLFSITPKAIEDLNNQKIAKIQEAIDLGVAIKMQYLSSVAAEVTEREVIPREIKQDKKNLYLIGFCNLRNDERTFRIDGILHLEIV